MPRGRLHKRNLDQPEDQWFDRKSGRVAPQELANAMIGFANADGGMIVVGLSDGKVEGIDQIVSRMAAWQQAAPDFTVPPVPRRHRSVGCVNHRGVRDHLLVVEVETSGKVYANQRDEVFLRVGDENRKLTLAQRQELL